MKFKVGDRVRWHYMENPYLNRIGITKMLGITKMRGFIKAVHNDGLLLTVNTDDNVSHSVPASWCRLLKKKEKRRIWISESNVKRAFTKIPNYCISIPGAVGCDVYVTPGNDCIEFIEVKK